MKTTLKKILLILSAVMIFAVVLCFDVSAKEVSATGYCGEEDDPVTWSYNSETKELVISGKGFMCDYSTTQYETQWTSPFQYSDIKSVVVEDGVRTIGNGTFYGCSNLETVSLGKDVVAIGESAFEDCKKLEGIVLGGGIARINEYAFAGCSSLETVVLGENITTIEEKAFSGCKYITAVTVLGKDFTDIGCFSDDVIIHCYKDSAIYSPNKTCVLIDGTEEDYIVGGSFGKFSWTLDKRTGLLKINGSGELPPFGEAGTPWEEYENYILQTEYSEGFETVNYNYNDRIKTVNLPSTVRKFSFNKCERLESIVIPEGVTSIEGGCFSGCTNLKSVTIPDTVTSIGRSAFSGCDSLKTIELPDSLIEIGIDAFSSCNSLETVILPKNLKVICFGAFRKCNSLESISIPESVIYIDN